MHAFCCDAAIGRTVVRRLGLPHQHATLRDAQLRVLLLHDTQHDLPAVESVLLANGYEVRSMAVNAITLQGDVERWDSALILIAAAAAARDVMEQICVSTQCGDRPIVVFTEGRCVSAVPWPKWRSGWSRPMVLAVARSAHIFIGRCRYLVRRDAYHCD